MEIIEICNRVEKFPLFIDWRVYTCLYSIVNFCTFLICIVRFWGQNFVFNLGAMWKVLCTSINQCLLIPLWWLPWFIHALNMTKLKMPMNCLIEWLRMNWNLLESCIQNLIFLQIKLISDLVIETSVVCVECDKKDSQVMCLEEDKWSGHKWCISF